MAKTKTAKKSSKKGLAIAAAALVAVGAFMPSEEEEVPETPVDSEIVIQEEQSNQVDDEIIIEDEPVQIIEPTETPEPVPEPVVVDPAPVVVDPEVAFREKLSQYAYVASAESDKFHYPSCQWTKSINDKNLIAFDSKEEAKAAGYTSCGSCNP